MTKSDAGRTEKPRQEAHGKRAAKPAEKTSKTSLPKWDKINRTLEGRAR